MSTDFFPGGGLLPHGTWLLEGNLQVTTSLGSCASRASVMALGNVTVSSNSTVALMPAAPKQFILLAGRDLQVGSAATLSACGSGGSVMTHEQLSLNGLISAQVVVEDQASCSPLVAGTLAISSPGAAQIDVSSAPSYYSGPLAAIRSWSE